MVAINPHCGLCECGNCQNGRGPNLLRVTMSGWADEGLEECECEKFNRVFILECVEPCIWQAGIDLLACESSTLDGDERIRVILGLGAFGRHITIDYVGANHSSGNNEDVHFDKHLDSAPDCFNLDITIDKDSLSYHQDGPAKGFKWCPGPDDDYNSAAQARIESI